MLTKLEIYLDMGDVRFLFRDLDERIHSLVISDEYSLGTATFYWDSGLGEVVKKLNWEQAPVDEIPAPALALAEAYRQYLDSTTGNKKLIWSSNEN